CFVLTVKLFSSAFARSTRTSPTYGRKGSRPVGTAEPVLGRPLWQPADRRTATRATGSDRFKGPSTGGERIGPPDVASGDRAHAGPAPGQGGWHASCHSDRLRG